MLPRRPRPLLLVALVFALALGGPSCHCDEPAPRQHRGGPPTRLARRASTLDEVAQAEWRRTDDPRYAGWLGDSRPAVRARAALAVGRAGLSRYTPALIELLEDLVPEVRARAAFGLRLLALDGAGAALRRRVAAALARRLDHERAPRVRDLLIVGLGWTAGRAAFDRLRPLLAGPDADAALLAWGLLSGRRQGAPRHVHALRAALEHGPPRRRRLATWALYRLWSAVGPTRAPSAKRRIAARRADRPLIRLLRRIAANTRAADHASTEARAWAIRALSARQPVRQFNWLLTRLRDPEPLVQRAVLRALPAAGVRGAKHMAAFLPKLFRGVGSSHYRLTGPRLAPLLSAMAALEPHVRNATVRHYAQQLLEASDAANSSVKYAPIERHAIDLTHCAAASLVDIGFRRLRYLPTCGSARAKTLDGAWRRSQVVRAIGAVAREPVWKLTMLRRYLSDKSARVRAIALRALASIDTPAVAVPLRRALADKDPVVLAAAASLVVKRARHLGAGSGEIAVTLARRLERLNALVQPEVACTLVSALAALRARVALPLLRKLTESPARAMRLCAGAALSRLGIADQPPPSWLSRGLPDTSWLGTAKLPTKAVLVTRKGVVLIELFPREAPATVASFARLAHKRFFNGKVFHRVVPGFVVQGGDPRGDGWGGPGYTLPCELTPRRYARGSVGMALAGRDTGGSQFFITLSRQPRLDGRYTLFGRVVAGMDVVERLQQREPIQNLYVTARFPKKFLR